MTISQKSAMTPGNRNVKTITAFVALFVAMFIVVASFGVMAVGSINLTIPASRTDPLVTPGTSPVALDAGTSPVELGTAGSFAILSQTGLNSVTANASVINGNVGVNATGTEIAITCFEVNGTLYAIDDTGPPCSVVDTELLNASVSDMQTAYTDASERTPDSTTAVVSMDGMEFSPGVYKWSAAATTTAGIDITISGDATDVWIFQITDYLSIGAGSKVILTGGADPSNIFWQVGNFAVLGADSVFNGNILSNSYVSLGNSASLNGSALAKTYVALDTNTITQPTATTESAVDPITPYWNNTGIQNITANATGTDISNVTLWYRYSMDNISWSNNISFGTDHSEPWNWTFTFPNGEGYYEFYSIANDTANNTEAAPATADAISALDTTAPTSECIVTDTYWRNSNLIINATASDNLSGLANVTLWWSYSADNISWFSTNMSFGTDTSAPWSWEFDFPAGNGYYKFYTIATDNATNKESAPPEADVLYGFDNVPPTSNADAITPYITTTRPLTITATANDDTSGLATVTLWYRYSADNISWNNNISFGTDTSAPWSREFDFPAGNGYYRFYTIATDNATNVELAPASADTEVMYDITSPTIIETTPINNSNDISIYSGTYVIQFSEEMDTTAGMVETTLPDDLWTWSADNIWYNATYTELELDTKYYVNLTGFTDLAGNALSGDMNMTFTTGDAPDTTPPTVSSTVPTNEATGVAINSAITATFSEAMDPTTINTNTFTLKQDTTPISGKVTYKDYTATFTPTDDLAFDTTYTATITTGAKDLAGNALATDYVWTFITGDFTTPTMDYILVTDSPDGTPLDTVTLSVGGSTTAYASGYNNTAGYIGLVEVNWTGLGCAWTPTNGTSSTFTAGTLAGKFTQRVENTTLGIDREFFIEILPDPVVGVTIAPVGDAAVVAGDILNFIVWANDTYGNVVTTSVLDAEYWANTTNGLFDINLVGVYDVNATYDGIVSNVVTVTVVAGGLDTITNVVIAPAGPITITTGTNLNFIVWANDTYGNTVTTNTSDAEYWANTTNGVFDISLVGVYDVNATYNGVVSNVVVVTVEHGGLTTITSVEIAPVGATTLTAGDILNFIVWANDTYGNVVTSDVTVAEYWANATDGVFSISLVGEYDVSATYNGVVSNVVVVTVQVGGLDTITSVEIAPVGATTLTAGATLDFTVVATDVHTNVVTTDVLDAGGWANATDGVFSINLVGEYDVSATYNGVVSNVVVVTVEAGDTIASVGIALLGDATVTAGDTLGFVVWANDTHGNLITGDVTHFTWTNATQGIFNNETVGTYNVKAGFGIVESNTITVTVTPAEVENIVITPAHTDDVVAGEDLTFTATAYDHHGNLITSDVTEFVWDNATNGVFNEAEAGTYNVIAGLDGVNSVPIVITVIDKEDPDDANDTDTIPTTIPVIIGPVNDVDGKPMAGATVTVVYDGETYTGTTDASGNAVIALPVFAVGQELDVTVSKDGYDTLSFQTTVDADGTPSTQPPVLDVAAKESRSLLPYIFLVVLVVVGLVFALLYFKKRGGKPTEDTGEQAEPVEEGEYR